MKESKPPKSALGKWLEAEGARIPVLREGGISAWLSLEREDGYHGDVESGFVGAVKISPHIMFKIPFKTTQREIRLAVKELLTFLFRSRGEFDEAALQAARERLSRGRIELNGESEPRARRRGLERILTESFNSAYGQAGKTVGELRGESRALFGSQTGGTNFHKKRNRWIRRRYKELGRERTKSKERHEMICRELLQLGEQDKNYFGRWAWKKQNPYALTEEMVQKIIWHKRL